MMVEQLDFETERRKSFDFNEFVKSNIVVNIRMHWKKCKFSDIIYLIWVDLTNTT